MNEIVYTAEPALRHPGRFLTGAAEELRRSLAVAGPLFRANLQARHRRAWLGYLWLLVPTVATTLVWMYVQSRRIVGVAPTGLPYPLFVLSGMIFWQVFVDALNAPLAQLSAGRQLITRSRVPPEALLVAGGLEVIVNCGMRLVVLAALMLFLRVPPGANVFLLPLAIAALAIFGLALGIATAPLGMLFDDVGRAIGVVTGFWFFLTPVLYPARGVMRFNPLTPLVGTARQWLTGGAADDGFAFVVAFSIPALAAAWLFQRLARPHVVARLG
jgi:lipopolysaccharide transport system permease protein